MLQFKSFKVALLLIFISLLIYAGWAAYQYFSYSMVQSTPFADVIEHKCMKGVELKQLPGLPDLEAYRDTGEVNIGSASDFVVKPLEYPLEFTCEISSKKLQFTYFYLFLKENEAKDWKLIKGWKTNSKQAKQEISVI